MRQAKPKARNQPIIAENVLSAIVESVDDAIVIKSIDGTITIWNSAAEKIFGYNATEIIGKSITVLFPPDRLGEEQEIMTRLKAGESIDRFDTVRVHKDGKLISLSLTITPIRNKARKIVGASKIARDTTEWQKSQEKLLLLGKCINQLEEVIIITEAESLDDPGPRIIFVNDAFEKYLGYSALEVIGRSPRFLQGPKTDRKTLAEIRQALKDYQPITRELINYDKSGRERWVELHIVPILDSNQTCRYYAAVQRDITKMREREEALRLSEECFTLAFENAPNGMSLVSPTGSWLKANRALCNLVGYTAEELYQKSFQDLTHPDDLAVDLEHLRRMLAGEINSFERPKRYIHKDGHIVWIYLKVALVRDCHGQPLYSVVQVQDITESKRASEKIAEQAALLDKTHDAITVRDLEGRVLFWNKGAESVCGWTSEEVIGRQIEDVIFKNTQVYSEATRVTMEKGKWAGEMMIVHKDGHELITQSNCSLIRDEAGRPKAILSICYDITDRKKIEAQFMRAQRMESIGTLAGGIAHDLNNILSPILLSIDMLKHMVDKNPQAEQILKSIEISAKRGADIVHQVLAFARGIEGQRIEVQPKHLVKDLEHIVMDTFPKDIHWQLQVPHDTWTVQADPTQIQQVLLNLCVNARDAMPEGGMLKVKVENLDVDGQYAATHLEARPGTYVVISVTDEGKGIPNEILNNIFEPFFTTKELGKGTGLGLSTVLAIVQGHKGFINVYSEPGKGSCFKIYLPALTTTDFPLEFEENENLPSGKGETILLVEDEAPILAMTSQTLESYGYHVLTAKNGAEAVVIYAQKKDEIALVITDMLMPVMDGVATINALLSLKPDIKIIAASGLGSHGSLSKLAETGVRHFLTKPHTAATLLQMVQGILAPVST